MAENNLELATLPTYDGRTSEQTGKSGMSAENFLSRMEAFTATIPAPDPPAVVDTLRINRTANQLRGNAATWWSYVAGTQADAFGLDKDRMHNEWDYFKQEFKARFFAVQDNVDVVADISDIKQIQGEPPQQYIERLAVTIGAVNAIWEEQTVAAITAANTLNTHLPAQLVNHLANPNDHPLTPNQLRTHITAAMRAAAKHYVRHHTKAQGFIQVCRSVGRNATDDKVRTRALKVLQDNPEPNFRTLINAVRQEERAHRRPANQARMVSQVDDDGQGYDPHTGNPVSAAGAYRGRGRGRGGRGGGRGGSNQRDNGKYCTWCRRKGHDLAECRTVQQHIQERDGEASSKVNAANQQQKQTNNQRGNQFNPRGGQKSKKASSVQDDQDDEDQDSMNPPPRVSTLTCFGGSPYAPGN